MQERRAQGYLELLGPFLGIRESSTKEDYESTKKKKAGQYMTSIVDSQKLFRRLIFLDARVSDYARINLQG